VEETISSALAVGGVNGAVGGEFIPHFIFKVREITVFFSSMEMTQLKLGLVAHACNPSYSGCRSRRFVSLRPAWELSLKKFF
jgi:hypothetical protein